MLHNMVHPQDYLPIDEITSPLGAQMLEFCESELFPVTLQNSEVALNSNCCYEEQSSNQTHPSTTSDMNKYNDNEIKTTIPNSTAPSTPIAISGNNLSMIFNTTDDPLENDISASIDFSLPQQYFNQETFDVSSLNNPLPLGDLVDGSFQYDLVQGFAAPHPPPGLVPMLGPAPVATGYEDECGLPSYVRFRTSVDPMVGPFLTSGTMSGPSFSCESQAGIFARPGLMMGNGISHQDLDFQGDNGLFLPDTIMPRVFNSDLQALSSESQHHGLHGGASSTTPLATEISSLEDSTFKVGKLSVEERKRKIHRYMTKRNERNFSKKIKYACRKTLADSRPRVRGRFAKNDEQGEITRINGSNHEYDDTDEDVSLYSTPIPDDHRRKSGVKEEDDMDSSDIFAHISGVNSFKCSYPIQSWI